MIKSKRNKGFTLLEILLVIAAIGILAAIVLIAINPNKQIEAAREAKRKSDQNAIAKAIQQYIIEKGVYPPKLQEVGVGGTVGLCVVAGCSNGIDLSSALSDYISSIPIPDRGQYLVTKTANGVSTGYDNSNIWATASGGTTVSPSLDLNFARDKSLIDSVSGNNPITFTRGSIGTYTGSDGLLKTAVANEPRFDHNPVTRESLGLLVEEQRTNSIPNNTMQGAVAGTPGTLPTGWGWFGNQLGLTMAVTGVGTENGINYSDIRISGTATGAIGGATLIAFHPQFATTAANGQTWTSSVYARVVGGSMANITGLLLAADYWNSSNGYIGGSYQSLMGLSSSLQRYTLTNTANNATTATVYHRIPFSVNSGSSVDVTIRWGLPQLEQGAFATSVIPTSGSTIQRFADNVIITGTNFSSWYNNTAGAIYAEAAVSSGASYTGWLASIGPSFNDGILMYRQSDDQFVGTERIANGYVMAATGTNPNKWTGTGKAKTAFTLSVVGGGRVSLNGALNTNGDIATSSMLSNPTSMTIGALAGGSNYFNGTIGRLTYWKTRLSNTVLQSITQ